MYESDVSQNFWAEAINLANYVLNRCLICPILTLLPINYLKGRNPIYPTSSLLDANALFIIMAKIT